MTNREKAIVRANEIDASIIKTLESGKSFRVEAGAGSGKTYSLERVVDWIGNKRKEQYKRYGHKVACITYTNAAVDVITERLANESFIKPCTIHTFAWDLIKRFKSSLLAYVKELNMFPASLSDSSESFDFNVIKNVVYTLGVRYFENDTLYLNHDDVIQLFVKMLDSHKFRLILEKEYPLILIDEYQDSFRVIMNQFLKYFIEPEVGPQFGLFGDSWQTIYGSQGACGLVESEKLIVINKEANFRSQKVIVDVLNNIRPCLPQFSALDDNDGAVIVITTDKCAAPRVQRGYYRDEIEESFLFDYIDNVTKKLESGWTGQTKKLMLTHKMLSKQNGYSNLLNILGDHLKNRDDEHFLFFQNKVEPIFNALIDNDLRQLFEILGVKRRPIESKTNKRLWREFKSNLSYARGKTIRDVLEIVISSRLVDVPQSVAYWFEEAKKDSSVNLYHHRAINELYNIRYSEIINAIDFYKPDSEFSTDHGVKGEEYDNVLLVIGRGWNDYKFDEQLYLDPLMLDDSQMKNYIRNRNLFYVCCSRPKKNLAILITVPINIRFREYLERVFGAKNIISYNQFICGNQ